ncbi:caspase family protein [Fertoebacter nigrum]|uniref:Caspase family protein n=1 Tax=Fertoeibacter niger TaxID=2656921 RepID=A0A8X8KQ30_9RHOB|nr:caspase family protein [Fertoeibacter niger]NUB46745.1 caspase family protein [Fertoeibacter niger]
MNGIGSTREVREACRARRDWQALRRRLATLCLILILGVTRALPTVAQGLRDDVLVLAIGNSRYKSDGRSDAPDVPYAGNDAKAFAGVWTTKYGVVTDQVSVRENFTLSNLRALFGTETAPEGQLHKSLPKSVRTVIVFFSGHGVPGSIRAQDLGGSQPFLLPVDGTAGAPEQTAYPLSDLVAALARLPVDNVVLVLDACFTGLTPAPEATMVEGSSAGFGVAFAAVKTPAKVAILSATSRDGNQFANWLDDRKHGAFTWHLLEGLRGAADRNRDRDMMLHELFGYVDDRLSVANLRQPPGRAQNPNLNPPQADLLLAVLPDVREQDVVADGVLTTQPPVLPAPEAWGSSNLESILEQIGGAVWIGPVTQPSSRTNYSMRLRLEAGEVKVDYPELSCGGHWTLVEVTGSTSKFRESIDYGQGRCVNDGDVLLRARTVSEIYFEWNRRENERREAWATLRPE